MFLCKLLGFDFSILYTPGKENIVAEEEEGIIFTSGSEGSLRALSVIVNSLLDEIKNEQRGNPEI